MVEKLQKDSDKSLADHQKEVLGAIAAAEKSPDAPEAGSADNDPMAAEMMTTAAGVSAFVSVAAVVREDLAASSKSSSLFVGGGAQSKKQNSLFVGGGSSTGSKATHTVAPLVPPSYGDKKAAARSNVSKPARAGDIFARSQISKMSLTGSSSSGGKSSPIKGAAVTKTTAKGLKAKELLQELGVVNQEMQKSYTSGSKRLMKDLSAGADSAEKFVQSTPDALKSTSPQFQQANAPSPQK